jgi:hypothetical protein
MKLLFTPLRWISARIAAALGRRSVERIWRTFDEQAPPKSDQRSAGWARLAAALALEGAVLRLAAGLFDKASREWFQRLTGRWPGGEHPDASGEKH